MRKDYVVVGKGEVADLEEDFVERFWTRHWDSVAKTPNVGTVGRSDEYRAMLPYLERLPPGSQMLDGGCGMGAWTVFLSSQGFNVVGLDISERTITRLKELLPRHRFVCGDIRRTSFHDGSFDAYLSWGTFEHFENGLGECVREARRVLKPGGLLFVSVPHQNWRHILRDSRALHKWDSTYDPTHGYRQPQRFYQWRLTRPELHRELELGGFRVLEIKRIGKRHGVYRWLQWDFRLFREGTTLFKLVQLAFSLVMPAGFISHMILAVAEKRRDSW